MLVLGLHKDNAIIFDTKDGAIAITLSENHPAHSVRLAITAPYAVTIHRRSLNPTPLNKKRKEVKHG